MRGFMNPSQIVRELLGEDNWVGGILGEASVHRPHRGRIYVAAYTSASGGQCTKSTGTDDPAAALVIAQEYEAAARAQRAISGRTANAPSIRNRQSPGNTSGGFTQAEVALLLGLSERAIRLNEIRALRKLAQHPELRELWHRYLTGELTEQWHRLSALEIEALWGLARSRAERETLRKVLAIVQR
jgi:hypothetical protein